MNLLEIALSHHQDQWYSGQVEIIWRSDNRPHHYAFLKNMGDFVYLFLSFDGKGLKVFYLDANRVWSPVPNLGAEYKAWAKQQKNKDRHNER